MKPYTVLLLRPDGQHEDHPSDWVCREHVLADHPDGAIDSAALQICTREASFAPDELVTLAVYEGHLFDLFQP